MEEVYELIKEKELKNNYEYAVILKRIIDEVDSKWDGVRIFAAIFYQYVNLERFQSIRAIVGLNKTSDREFSKGYKMGKYFIYKDLLSLKR